MSLFLGAKTATLKGVCSSRGLGCSEILQLLLLIEVHLNNYVLLHVFINRGDSAQNKLIYFKQALRSGDFCWPIKRWNSHWHFLLWGQVPGPVAKAGQQKEARTALKDSWWTAALTFDLTEPWMRLCKVAFDSLTLAEDHCLSIAPYYSRMTFVSQTSWGRGRPCYCAPFPPTFFLLPFNFGECT